MANVEGATSALGSLIKNDCCYGVCLGGLHVFSGERGVRATALAIARTSRLDFEASYFASTALMALLSAVSFDASPKTWLRNNVSHGPLASLNAAP